jgi:two-component system, LuxR family, response regulator FixJ
MPSDVVHVIDDDEAVRQSLKFLLESASIGVETHASATEFLRLLPEMERVAAYVRRTIFLGTPT